MESLQEKRYKYNLRKSFCCVAYMPMCIYNSQKSGRFKCIWSFKLGHPKTPVRFVKFSKRLQGKAI